MVVLSSGFSQPCCIRVFSADHCRACRGGASCPWRTLGPEVGGLFPIGSPVLDVMFFCVGLKGFIYADLAVISPGKQLSRVWLSATPWTAVRQASLTITNSQNLVKFMSIKLVMASNHLILCRPLLLSPSVIPSIRVFSSESVLRIRWPKYWSFSFSISPSNEYSGLISFRIDCLDLHAVPGTLKSLLQHCSSKTSILRHSAFFIVQLSHPYMTTGKTKALIRRTFVGKVISLLFNLLSRLVITFLPRSKHLLISWLQSPSAVIFGFSPPE